MTEQQPAADMRSIYERMTAPTPADMQVNQRLKTLGPQEIVRIIDHMGQVMEHLAAQRDEVTVNRFNRDGVHGFSVEIDLMSQK